MVGNLVLRVVRFGATFVEHHANQHDQEVHKRVTFVSRFDGVIIAEQMSVSMTFFNYLALHHHCQLEFWQFEAAGAINRLVTHQEVLQAIGKLEIGAVMRNDIVRSAGQ